MSGHPAWSQVVVQPGLGSPGGGIHMQRLGHGQRVKEWAFHQARGKAPRRTLQPTGPSGSLLLHLHSSLSTFLRLSGLTQSCRNFTDQNFRFQKGKLRLRGRQRAARDLSASGGVGTEAGLLGLCHTPRSTPWRQTHERDGVLMKPAN